MLSVGEAIDLDALDRCLNISEVELSTTDRGLVPRIFKLYLDEIGLLSEGVAVRAADRIPSAPLPARRRRNCRTSA